ncbi:MAG: hypothetical protein ACJAS3_002611, partial [Roseivirga sp.]
RSKNEMPKTTLNGGVHIELIIIDCLYN